MALSDDESAVFRRLSAKLTRSQKALERLHAYYEGTHRLETLGLAVPPSLERFVTVVNWPRVTVDSPEQRCDVEGFRLIDENGDADAAADELWNIWQANDLDEESQLLHLDSMKLGCSYACVGGRDPDEDELVDGPDGDVPLITVETPFEMTHESDPRTRRVSAALRRTQSTVGLKPKWATLYLPNQTVWLEHQGARGWVDVDRDEHDIGRPLVEPFVNRPSLRTREGTSEMADVIGLTDAACRALTNAQVATEVMAIPQRYAAGMVPTDFVDKDGKPLTTWETYFGAIWATANKDAKFGQFTAADLKNFETIVNHYANLASGVSGLPTRFYGQYTTNPPSEGSIVADETRLIMNAYRHHRWLGGGHERIMRLARRIIDGDWDPRLRRMETLWRNPETPTRAQTADAVTKLFSARDAQGRALLPLEAAREELGFSATRRRQLTAMDDDDQAAARRDDPVARAAEAFRRPVPAPATDPTSADPASTDPAAAPSRTPAFSG